MRKMHSEFLNRFFGSGWVCYEGRVVGKTRKIIFDNLEAGDIETVYVERYNLALRHGISRLVRKSLCFSKCKNMLEDHLDPYQCYTNFIRPHLTLAIKTPERGQKHREDAVYG